MRAPLALAACLWVAACRPAATEKPRPDASPAPARVLHQYKLAYNTPDAALAGSLLDRSFTWTPAPEVAAFPAAWGYGEEVASSAAMFGSAYHIILEFITTDAAVGKPPPGALAFRTRPLDTRLRVWRDPAYCWYARGEVVFTMKRGAVGEPWLIAGGEDRTSARLGDVAANAETRLASWSDIKLHYLREARGDDGP